MESKAERKKYFLESLMIKMRDDMSLLKEWGEKTRGKECQDDLMAQEKNERIKEDKKDIFEWLKLSTK